MADVRPFVRILGPVGVENGQSDEPLNPSLRRLVARLAIHRGETVPEPALIDALWEDGELPANPTRSLQTYVSRLRAQLGSGSVERVAAGYRLAESTIDVDATVFDRSLALARQARDRADDRSAVGALAEGLALWKGPALGDLATTPWATAEAHRLDELRIDAQEQRAELLLGLQDVDGELVAGLERLARDHPHREGPTRLLMLALAGQGRQAEALAAFSRHRRHLATDLGLEPSEELRRLEAQVLTDGAAAVAAQVRGRPLRGYQIIERLGEGAFSIVYRGAQPSVGREVAIKQIRAELANRPEFIRRFETEAHLVARLEHPHIVPLYDFWREPDSAYLVMRLLRGGSLESSLRSGPWDLDRTLAMTEEIGHALSVAHRSGVVHRDVKPANILLDDDGGAYLTDFGIALDAAEAADPEAALSAGSPAYASPEQLRRQPVGPAADVHGLAIAVYESLTGQLPFPDEPTQAALLQRQLHDPIPSLRATRPDLPGVLDGVLARATAKAPEDRFQTIDGFLAALREAAERSRPEATTRRIGVGTAVSGEVRNPYKGLRSFGEGDAGDFAGRSRLVDQLVETLRQHRLVAVVGPSGSGKSSVVHAGLVPALRQGAVRGSDRWFVTTLLPGPRPFEELETALLRVAGERPPDLLGVLTSGPRGIARGVRQVALADEAQILLVIDQFEELFTLAPPDESARFLDALATAVTEERPRLRVVLTLRADFYDRPLRHEAVGRLVKEATVAVLPLAADELDHAIVDPAHGVGSEFEPGLVSEIVADVADHPGALPMLQYALTELWERRVSEMMTRTAYRELGGVSGALARRAEELYAESTADDQETIRRLFGRLVNLGEGTGDTRRRVRRSELGSGSMDSVIERFGRARLLSFDRDPASREPTVEVAHEALIREWPRLSGWIDDDRDGLRIHRHLTAAATSWKAAERDEGELYRGARLEAAAEWAHLGADLNDEEREFLAASEALARREKAQARRQVQRLRRALAAVAVVAALAVIAGALALVQQRRADTEAATAETRRLVADAASIVDQNRNIALLLAVEAYNRDPSPQTLSGLQRVLSRTGSYLGQIGDGQTFLGGDWLDDGRIVGVTAGEVQYYDPETWAVTGSIALGATPRQTFFKRVALDIDGNGVVIGTDAGEVVLIEGGTRRALPVGPDPIAVVAYDAADGLIAAGDTAGRVHLLDAPSGEERWARRVMTEDSFAEVMGPDGWAALPAVMQSTLVTVEGLSFRSGAQFVQMLDGGDVLVGAGPFLRRLDGASGVVDAELLLESAPVPGLPAFPRVAKAVTVTPDGHFAVLAGTAALADVDPELTSASWADVPTGRASRVQTTSVVLDPSGTPWVGLDNGLVATGTIEQASDGRATPIGLASVQSIAGSPDNDAVLAAGDGGMVLWSIDGHQLLASAAPRGGNDEAYISADGRQLITTSSQGGIDTLFYDDSGDGWTPHEVAGMDLTLLFSNDTDPLNRWLVSFEPGGTLTRIDRSTMQPNGVVHDSVNGDSYSLDGRIHAMTTFEGTLLVHDAITNEAISPEIDLLPWMESAGPGQAGGPTFDPVRPLILVSFPSGRAVVFDTQSWTVARVIEPDDEGGGVVVGSYSRDGSMLVTRGSGGAIAVRDPVSFAVERIIEGGNSAVEIATRDAYISADNEYLLTVRDDAPRLWHLPTGTLIGTFPHEAGVVASGNDLGDELRLVTLVDEHALVWNLDPTSWPAIACQAAGRNLNADEWKQFGPADEPHHATCPQWPLSE